MKPPAHSASACAATTDVHGRLCLLPVALAALEQEGMPRVWIGYLFMFATIVLYAPSA
jgi:hypothetical protein